MDTTKKLTPLEIEIERLKAESKAKLDEAINKATKEATTKEARKALEKKIEDEKTSLEVTHKGYIKNFEQEYGVKYLLDTNIVSTDTPEKSKLKLEEKCKLAEVELNKDNQLKYRMNDTKDAIIGAKGEPITSVIKIRVDGKIETISVRNFFQYLKPEATKEELDKLYPNKK